MDAIGQAVMNTALMYIGMHFGVNTVCFSRAEPDYVLPGYRPEAWENRVIQRMLDIAGDRSIYVVQDRLFAVYVFAFAEDMVAAVGPYRQQWIYRSQLPEDLFSSNEEKDAYLKIFHGYPLAKANDVQLGINLMFSALYGPNPEIKVNNVDLRTIEIDAFEASVPAKLAEQHVQEEDEEFLRSVLVNYIEQGNQTGAVRIYRRLMHNRGQPFILLNTIEGLTSLRTNAALALQNAGVSKECANQVLIDFKLQGRTVTNLTQARELCEKMIYDCCALVRRKLSSPYSDTVRTVVDYIHDHLSEELTLTVLAEKVNLTTNALTTKFHNEVGQPPIAYITQCRMENAAMLLRRTHTGIPNICAHVGIVDTNYFSRCFKKHYGMTPTEYRRRNHNN